MSLAPQTLVVGIAKPVPLFGNDQNALAIITNIGGLDYAGITEGPSDILLGSAFGLTNLQAVGLSSSIVPTCYLLSPGAQLALPTLDQIWALAVTRDTTITLMTGLRA